MIVPQCSILASILFFICEIYASSDSLYNNDIHDDDSCLLFYDPFKDRKCFWHPYNHLINGWNKTASNMTSEFGSASFLFLLSVILERVVIAEIKTGIFLKIKTKIQNSEVNSEEWKLCKTISHINVTNILFYFSLLY